MKKSLIILLMLVIFCSFSIGQERIDVIYLNNGDVVKGIIIENVPNDYVRIELQGGSIFTYKYSRIAKFTKEMPTTKPNSGNTSPTSPTIIMQQQQQQQQSKSSYPSKSTSSNTRNFPWENSIDSWIMNKTLLVIQTKTGLNIRGKLIKGTKDGEIAIITVKGNFISLKKSDIMKIAALPPLKSNIGIGIGLAYGIAGFSFEYNLSNNISAVVGYGSTLVAGPGYGFGFRFILSQPHKTFHPRVSLLYGTNAFYMFKSDVSDTWDFSSGDWDEVEVLTGLDICAGFAIYFGNKKNHVLDFDIAYIPGLMDTFKEKTKELESDGWTIEEYQEGVPIDISFGYRFRF